MWQFQANEYLTNTSALANAAPMSFACWFRITTTGLRCLIGVADAGATTNQLLLYLTASSRLAATAGGFSVATGTTVLSTGTIYHGAAVFRTTTDRSVYVNGVNEATSTVIGASTGGNRTYVARRPNNDWQWLGHLGEIGIWNAALSDDEVRSLAEGTPTQRVNFANLVSWVPLRATVGSSARDYLGAGGTNGNFTIVGSPALTTQYYPILGPPWMMDADQSPKKIYVEAPGFLAARHARQARITQKRM